MNAIARGTAGVVVVNETLAGRLWPDRAPPDVVGQHVRLGGTTGATNEVVGVAANVRSRRPDAGAGSRDLHRLQPVSVAVAELRGPRRRRSGGVDRPDSRELAQMTPNVALAAVRTFEEVVTNANRTSGLLSWLSVLFGVLAAALAILGIYSVMSYTVAQRERELAIRAAVGASRSSLLSMVLREGLILSGAGIAAGAVDRLRVIEPAAQPALRGERHRSAGVRRIGAGPGGHCHRRVSDPRRPRRARRAGHGAPE